MKANIRTTSIGFLLILLFAAIPVQLRAALIPVSGGGLETLHNAFNAAHPGDILEIQDSLTYGPSATAFVATTTSHSGLVIRALAGQTPTISLNNTFTGNTNFQFGTNSGGRITIAGGAGALFMFILNNSNSLETLFENCNLVGLDNASSDIAIYMPSTSAATRNYRLDNCRIFGWRAGDGSIQINESQGGADGTATVNSLTITNCVFEHNNTSIITKLLDNHGAGANTQITITNCRILRETGTPMWFWGEAVNCNVSKCYASAASNIIVGNVVYTPFRGGKLVMDDSVTSGCGVSADRHVQVTIDHCDIVSKLSPAIAPDAGTCTGTLTVTNSNVISQAASGKSFGKKGSGSAVATLTSNYNNAPQGYANGWAAGANDIAPAVDPLYSDIGSNYRIMATPLVNAGSDGVSIGSQVYASSAGVVSTVVTPVSGGGAETLHNAFNAAHPGDTLLIQDSLTYGPSATAFSANNTSHSGIVIRAATGQTPTISLNNTFTGNTNLHFGSNAGGRITIAGGAGALFMFILNNSNASVLWPLTTLFENCNLNGLDNGSSDIAVYMPSTSAALRNYRFNNCTIFGWRAGDSSIQLNESQGGVDGTATVNSLNISSCTFQHNLSSLFTKLLDNHGAGAKSQINLTNCRILQDGATPLWFWGEAVDCNLNNCFIQAAANVTVGNSVYPQFRGGKMVMNDCVTSGSGISADRHALVTLNHCDIISKLSPAVAPDAGTCTGTLTVTNSNVISRGGSGVSFGKKGTGSAVATLISDYNDAQQGYADGWIAGTHDVVPGVDPQYNNEGSDFRVNAPQLLLTASDGRDIGSARQILANGDVVPVELSEFALE